MVVLLWSASPEQLLSWGDAASEGKVTLQRPIQISAHLFGESMKGMVKSSGSSPGGFPCGAHCWSGLCAQVVLPWPTCQRGLGMPPLEASEWG